MHLEQLGTDFNIMSQMEQRIFFLLYSERRAVDLAKPVTFRGAKKSGEARKKGKNVKVTTETLGILKGLGLV